MNAVPWCHLSGQTIWTRENFAIVRENQHRGQNLQLLPSPVSPEPLALPGMS